MPTRRATPRRGFTLLETALATIIIGVGVLAVIEAQQAFLVKNAWSTNASTATYLAVEIREMTRGYNRHDRFSGGLYFTDPDDATTLTGWGPEPDETNPVDFDDLDDFDGAVFGSATTFPTGFSMRNRYDGPIDAFTDTIPETLWDGSVETVDVGGTPQEVAMRGWTQIVEVDKVLPDDLSTTVSDAYFEEDAGVITTDVDGFPLRVRVTVLFQDTLDTSATPVTTVTWIVPPR